MFSSTARVCSRMSNDTVPTESTDAPAIVLSGRRLDVPDTNANPPATFTCGNRPRGTAFPGTTVPLMTYPQATSNHQQPAASL